MVAGGPETTRVKAARMVADEIDSRPLIDAPAEGSLWQSSSSSRPFAPGSIPEEGEDGVEDSSFRRFIRGEAATEPPPEQAGLPLLEAFLSRAQWLSRAQSALSLAALACAAVVGEPSWLGWLLLAGVAVGMVALAYVQLRGFSHETLTEQLRRAPPAFLEINTAQPPLMQALRATPRHATPRHATPRATRHATCTPRATTRATTRHDTTRHDTTRHNTRHAPRHAPRRAPAAGARRAE